MAASPTFALAPTFMGIEKTDPAADYCICGVPYDFGVSNRPGARFAPAAIRTASRMLVDGDHPVHWVNPLSLLNIADIGNLAVVQGDILGSLALIEQQYDSIKHPITLGGDHTISLPILRSLAKKHGPMGLVHFDAHVDTWPDNYSGPPFGHGNSFYHAIQEGLIDPERMVQIGIRSPVRKEVYDWTVNKGVYIWTAEEVHEMGIYVSDIAEHIVKVMTEKTTPVYLTMDIDVLDPGFAPGTGTPEIGGLNPWQVQTILRKLGGLDFVGMDLVEVSPPYDVSEITALAGATFVWEYLSLLAVPDDDEAE